MSWLKLLVLVTWLLAAAMAKYLLRATSVVWRKMSWVKILFLIVVVGEGLGLLSWLIYGGSAAVAWWFAGGTGATGALVLVGKLTTPLWVIGMTRASKRHWPVIGRLLNGIGPWWEVNYSTVVGFSIVIAGFTGIIWLCCF